MVTRLKSKRNRVVKIGLLVFKQARCKLYAQQEAQRLRNLKKSGVRVPRVMAVFGRTIIMQYIPSQTLTDYLESLEAGPPDRALLEKTAKMLCGWLDDFYRSTQWQKSGIIVDDENCRNFLVCNSGLWGVDFERDKRGEREENIGWILAFLESYRPQGTVHKRIICRLFRENAVESLGLDPEKIELYLFKARKELLCRRKAVKEDSGDCG